MDRETFLNGVELSIEEVRVAIAVAALKKAGVVAPEAFQFETLGLYPQAKGVLLIVGPVKANFEDGARSAVQLSSHTYLGSDGLG